MLETFGDGVVLPEQYRAKVQARPELTQYASGVKWVADLPAALAIASGAVIAVAPQAQPSLVTRCCASASVQTIILEKPVAVTPAQARATLEEVAKAAKRFRIGYTFLHTNWFEGLLCSEAIVRDSRLKVTWGFMAHHFANGLVNWKVKHSEGGGALRFYGIHLVAVLARLGYVAAARSTLFGAEADHVERWTATFTGPGLPDADVDVDTRSSGNCFTIAAESSGRIERLVDLTDPFAEIDLDRTGDRRIDVLKRLLGSLESSDTSYAAACDSINRLWQQTEAVSTYG